MSMYENLRKAEIKNGKICLEGKVIEAELIGLGMATQSSDDSSKNEFNIEKEDLLFLEVPENANAFIIGKKEEFRSTFHRYFIVGSETVYPVLYLKT